MASCVITLVLMTGRIARLGKSWKNVDMLKYTHKKPPHPKIKSYVFQTEILK